MTFNIFTPISKRDEPNNAKYRYRILINKTGKYYIQYLCNKRWRHWPKLEWRNLHEDCIVFETEGECCAQIIQCIADMRIKRLSYYSLSKVIWQTDIYL